MTKAQSRKILAHSLRYWRKKFGLTQADLSVDLDCKLPTYQSYEECRAEPSIITLKKLAGLYKITIEELIDPGGNLIEVGASGIFET
jgi:transcriptional regulator with XRE-family HTH domain